MQVTMNIIAAIVAVSLSNKSPYKVTMILISQEAFFYFNRLNSFQKYVFSNYCLMFLFPWATEHLLFFVKIKISPRFISANMYGGSSNPTLYPLENWQNPFVRDRPGGAVIVHSRTSCYFWNLDYIYFVFVLLILFFNCLFYIFIVIIALLKCLQEKPKEASRTPFFFLPLFIYLFQSNSVSQVKICCNLHQTCMLGLAGQ